MSDNSKRPMDRIEDKDLLEEVSAKNEAERRERERMAKRKRYQKVTNDDYSVLKEKWDKQSKSQEWWEWRVSRDLTRKTRRHLKVIEGQLKKLADCGSCPSRRECKDRERSCPAIEMYLIATDHSTETVAQDKIILESDWRPSESVPADKRDEFFSNYITYDSRVRCERPQLKDIKRGTDSIDMDIMAALLDGKLTVELIADENYVTLDYVKDIRVEVAEHLGCYDSIPTEDHKILRAILFDRLPNNDAAKVFGKKPADISRRRTRARKKLMEIFAPTSRG